MSRAWEVRVEGRADCEHHPEFSTLTIDPPIFEARCTNCGRTLWKQRELRRPTWPEDDPRPSSENHP